MAVCPSHGPWALQPPSIFRRIGDGLNENLPNLEEVVLTNNSMAELGDIMPLFECKKLERLRWVAPWRHSRPPRPPDHGDSSHLSLPIDSSRSLLNNPVTAAEHYREFLIYHLPKLRLLDFKKVTGKVRPCRFPAPPREAAPCSCADVHAPQERDIATQLFSGPAGDAILRDIVKHAKQ